MPLSAEYTWRETEKQIILTIPLKGSSPKSVDVFGSSVYDFSLARQALTNRARRAPQSRS